MVVVRKVRRGRGRWEVVAAEGLLGKAMTMNGAREEIASTTTSIGLLLLLLLLFEIFLHCVHMLEHGRRGALQRDGARHEHVSVVLGRLVDAVRVRRKVRRVEVIPADVLQAAQ